MKLNTLLDRLWENYTSGNPSAAKIYDLFEREGESVVNDHVAFRTLNLDTININVVAQPFAENGYVSRGEYFFKQKHLFARHFEIPGNNLAPRVFISELLLYECSLFVQKTFREMYEEIDQKYLQPDEILFLGSPYTSLSYEVYKKLRDESEYAAWFYVFGFRANHFTVNINSFTKYNNIQKVNELLKNNGFQLNNAGGEIKGTPADLLMQSSTMADFIKVNFSEGVFEIPCCYYEFAQRFPDSEGKLFSGFISKSADKIFESTNYYQKK